METHLEEQEAKNSSEQRSVRNVDRTVKDLQSQIERREKMNSQLEEDVNRGREKVERLLKSIDELQQSESDSQLQARRAERELREEREKSLKLERELNGWKALRVERGVGRSHVTFSDTGSRRGSGAYTTGDLPQRMPSNTKGFL